jgi:hypothetical protein
MVENPNKSSLPLEPRTSIVFELVFLRSKQVDVDKTAIASWSGIVVGEAM